MEIVPILSTIILVGTIATFILAVFAYILYKVREAKGKRRKKAGGGGGGGGHGHGGGSDQPHVLIAAEPPGGQHALPPGVMNPSMMQPGMLPQGSMQPGMMPDQMLPMGQAGYGGLPPAGVVELQDMPPQYDPSMMPPDQMMSGPDMGNPYDQPTLISIPGAGDPQVMPPAYEPPMEDPGITLQAPPPMGPPQSFPPQSFPPADKAPEEESMFWEYTQGGMVPANTAQNPEGGPNNLPSVWSDDENYGQQQPANNAWQQPIENPWQQQPNNPWQPSENKKEKDDDDGSFAWL